MAVDRETPGTNRWRQVYALSRLEHSLQSSRSGLFILQTGYLVGLSASLIWAVFNNDWGLSEPFVALAQQLGGFTYLAALILGPVLGSGALEEERERGMIEILSSSPIRPHDIFVSMVTARLVLVAQFVLSVLPLYVVSVFLGGIPAAEILVRTLVVTVIATGATTLFTLAEFARGRGAVQAYGLLVLLIVLTPRGLGLLLRQWIVASAAAFMLIWALSEDIDLTVSVIIALSWPFLSMANVIFSDSIVSPTVLSGVATGLALNVVFFREVKFAIGAWISREPIEAFLDSWASKKTERFSHRDRLVRLITGADTATREHPQDRITISTQAIEKLSGISRKIYEWSGQSALVIRAICERAVGTGLVWIWAILVGCFLVTQILWGNSPSQNLIANWNAATILFIGLLVSIGVSQLYPYGRSSRSAELFLSAPITGAAFVRGAVSLVLIQVWPIILMLFLCHGLFAIQVGYQLWVLAAYLHLLCWFGLLVGLCMWASLQCSRFGQRVAISQVIALATFFFSGISPLAHASNTNGEQLIWTVLALGTVDLLLFGSFVLLFDRMTRCRR